MNKKNMNENKDYEYAQCKYSMEELVPLVAKLSKKYTSNDSSSITYETAQRLMEAIIYCINQLKKEEGDVVKNKIDNNLLAEEAYELGYKILNNKVEDIKSRYGELIKYFKDYGNLNYGNTVRDGISGFIKYYDVRFNPTDTIITMDYPTLKSVLHLQGVDAISEYLNYIILEQRFLNKLEYERVIEALKNYQNDYEKQFYNICSIVLRYMLVEKVLNLNYYIIDEEAIDLLYKYGEELSKEQWKFKLKVGLKDIVKEVFENNMELYDYLETDIGEFATELVYGVKHNCLDKLFHIYM